MPLSWNEIKDRALAFSREWAKGSSEEAEAKNALTSLFPEAKAKASRKRVKA